MVKTSLQQQIELLDKVSQKESENFLNENKKGIDKATKEMEKNRHNYLGQFYDNGSDESEALKASVQKLQKTYGDEVVKLEKGSDGITMNVAIDADATTAKDALNDFMTEVSDIEKQYGESDTLELFENISDYYDKRLDYQKALAEKEEKLRDLSEAHGNYTKSSDYDTQIAEQTNQRAIEKADKFISKLDNINDLLTEEMMYDYDTGQLTDMGALSLTLNAQSMNDSLDTLQNYAKKRQQIIDDYNNKLFGEQKYDELMSENDSNIQNALKNANSYKQQILSIVKTQSQKEQDALFKVIDARKDALKKKKEYYDYDKQLKSKTKEINLLQQQIDALDGVKYALQSI